MSLYQELDAEWGECWLEPRPLPADVAAAIKKFTHGAMTEWGKRLGTVPWVPRAFLRAIDERAAHIPDGLWDLIHFVVSQDNACRYCYGATRTVLKILGYGDAAIDRLERDIQLAELTAPQKAALHFARRLSHANPPPGASDLRALVDAGFTGPQIAEIAFTAAFSGYANRVATMFAFPPDRLEGLVRNPMVRLLRPLFARQFRAKRLPTAALPAPNAPPFADLIARLEGSPTAHAVRAMIDDAFASAVLPRRTKLLMFAVIGRALAADHVEQEAQRALAADGLSRGDVEDVLANLDSERLDERERLLIPFARETVRYRSLAIQQRTRELSARLDIDELIEAVGVVSLANSVGRLAVLVAP
jgi:uncharacterized peroxidase-related enzyme